MSTCSGLIHNFNVFGEQQLVGEHAITRDLLIFQLGEF